VGRLPVKIDHFEYEVTRENRPVRVCGQVARENKPLLSVCGQVAHENRLA